MAQPLSRQIGVEFRTHTSDQMYVTAILRAAQQRCAPYLGAMTSSVIQFVLNGEIEDRGPIYIIEEIRIDSCRSLQIQWKRPRKLYRKIYISFFFFYRIRDKIIIFS